MGQKTTLKKTHTMQTTAVSRHNEPPTFRPRSFRTSMQRLLRDNVFRKKPPKPQKPLISHHSNVFHDQALMQLASVYESLQLGDSQEATMAVYTTGVRIFGRECFDRAVQERGVRFRGW